VRVRTQTGIVPSPYSYLISPVGTMHRAPTLPFYVSGVGSLIHFNFRRYTPRINTQD